ncbi:inorganic triphosphatase [Aeromonas cavernicola]|uniref:Adenylate cyclase n=1 Tax=Aeromonas cavernicola TaxID=1006623 RepID=A0A2H9U676_9GAMM|nr:CYTH domain-containing protein [Aeromonas cavernicola]PJG59557.1 adenylate cyclase [Aeromonas cavernicola]
MQTEIEIKFFVTRNIEVDLSNLLNFFAINEHSSQQLGNVYFDTPNLDLRRLEMGLRIRRCDTFAEQTIKCRGQVIGGLHARPEYNAPIHGDLPDLTAFPDHIWPSTTERDRIQPQLEAQFRTDFLRRYWRIAVTGGEIELAWDQGDIIGSQGRAEINELELELKSGDAMALFTVAQQLAQLGGLRLGAQSKAQRGYRLAGLGKPLGLVPLTGSEPLAELTGVSAGLHHWQHHEQLWLEHPQDLALQQQALHAMCQGIVLVADCASTISPAVSWLPALVNLLTHLQANLNESHSWPNELATLLVCPNYIALQLAITATLHHASK